MSNPPNSQPPTTSIDLDDGKYTIQHENGANLRCLRYGQPWRDLTGDKMVLAMADEIERLTAYKAAAEYQKALDAAKS